jgi:hypothetical protein
MHSDHITGTKHMPQINSWIFDQEIDRYLLFNAGGQKYLFAKAVFAAFPNSYSRNSSTRLMDKLNPDGFGIISGVSESMWALM